ncbi:hypothetical protein IRJ41_005008 [Triplophysa rosa]|uniref:DUF659 domain-containing protein n=1 Tax=Triplophysa rosa TaxID=992332 RepID=A0A9W7T4U8_TRIRA|nr:hypothetical protein IRJ41_005008 [Triplophysa rosa]
MSKRPSETVKSSKKLKNLSLNAKFRAEQYPNDFYESGQQLFCKFCQHSIDWTRKTTCDDHLKSKTHMRNKEKLKGKNLSLQCTIASTVASSDARREFVEDFVAVCAEADIPYEKMKKLRPFLIKHCKQGGSLPQNESSLRQTHLPRVFEQHMEAVLNKISGKKMWVDETTDIRDCSILNIVIGVEGHYFLTDVIFMESCNYTTFSQAIRGSLHRNNLDLNDVWALVTDNASYCLKAFKEVLKGVMPNSVHVTCLCHVINLVGETWRHYKYFTEVALLVTWMRSVFFKKPARKRRWVSFLIMKETVRLGSPRSSEYKVEQLV